MLNRQADIATEAYNTARVEMHQAVARMTGLQADLDRQRTQVADLRSEIVGTALSDYTEHRRTVDERVVPARQATERVHQRARDDGDRRASAGRTAHPVHPAAEPARRPGAAGRPRAGRDHRGQAGSWPSHKATVEAKIKAAKTLLGNLKEKARLRVLALQRAAAQATVTPPSRGERPAAERRRTGPPAQTAPAPPASGRAAIAVQTALAQLGKPYVYGAAGPNSFDCSGLTMYSWAAAGVSLSHASSVQSGQGVPVSISALQPGDLVFYYSPVSHVAMYIGNGQVVHAPHPGASVEIVPLYSMPISWARRVG